MRDLLHTGTGRVDRFSRWPRLPVSSRDVATRSSVERWMLNRSPPDNASIIPGTHVPGSSSAVLRT